MTPRKAIDLSLYLVVSAESTGGRPIRWIVAEAVAGGVTAVQLRRKGGSTRAFVAEGRELLALLRPLGIPLVVNDRADVAVAVGADGVHVGQDDLEPVDVRRLVGQDMIVGLSITNMAEARRADPGLIDYAGVGPVFRTGSKPDAAAALGLGGLKQIVAALPIPAVGIGGINPENADSVRATGVAGIAVMAAIGAAARPAAAAASLRGVGRQVPNVLSIAGSDPSGGAGIQADLKTFSALGVYGCAAITALTAQNTRGVGGILPTPADFLELQLETIRDDVDLGAIKVGMLATGPNARVVAGWLDRTATPTVLDPVISAGTGARLIDDDGIAVIRTELLHRVNLITPNASEVGVLLGGPAPRTVREAANAARALHFLGARAVLVTGGHLTDPADCVDLLFDGLELFEIRTPRISAGTTHGTGCTLSSAIAALLARGHNLRSACIEGQRFVAGAIRASPALSVGSGGRPVHQSGAPPVLSGG